MLASKIAVIGVIVKDVHYVMQAIYGDMETQMRCHISESAIFSIKKMKNSSHMVLCMFFQSSADSFFFLNW